MPTLGFLHTSPLHVDAFDALLSETNRTTAGVHTLHRVEEGLLAEARTRGPADTAVVSSTRRALSDLAEAGASVVVCTCSTLGAIAEGADAPERRVLRIDRPMADLATRADARLGVLAALESSLAPTRQLLEESASAQGSRVAIRTELVHDAWAHFEADDTDAYLDRIASAVRELAPAVDAIVLAQASMAGAAERCADVHVPIWSSPRVGVEAALALLEAS